MYEIIDSDQSAGVIHEGLADMTKMMKSINLKKWLRFLDTGHLSNGNPDAKDNQKCLYLDKDSRIHLPPYWGQTFKTPELLKTIETQVGVLRGHKKAGPAAGDEDAEELDAQTIVPAIENAIN